MIFGGVGGKGCGCGLVFAKCVGVGSGSVTVSRILWYFCMFGTGPY
jgi:hypothetical protein